MRSDFKVGMKVVSTMLFTCILCFFLYISVDVMIKQISTHVIGYDVIDTAANNGKGEKVGFVEAIPEERPENTKYISVYSEKPFAAKATTWALQAVLGVGVFFCTVGSVVAKTAARDRNDVDFNKGVHDRWRGFKIGFFASLPLIATYILAVVVKVVKYTKLCESYFWVYRWIITIPVRPFVDLFVKRSISLAGTPLSGILWTGIFAPLLIVFCAVMYFICYNEDSVLAKILYKSMKKKDDTRRIGGR